MAGYVHGDLLGEFYMQVSAADIFDSPGLKVLSQLGAGGLQTFCGFAERDVTLFVALRDALQVVGIFLPHAHCENRMTRLEQHQCGGSPSRLSAVRRSCRLPLRISVPSLLYLSLTWAPRRTTRHAQSQVDEYIALIASSRPHLAEPITDGPPPPRQTHGQCKPPPHCGRPRALLNRFRILSGISALGSVSRARTSEADKE